LWEIKMKLRPLHDKVLVKRTEEEETTAGGIVLPGSAAEKPSQGEVIAVGPGKRQDSGDQIAPDVKVGDTVIFGQYGGNEVKIDGEEYLILSESDIFGVVS
jgi:chaperonin GroES